jgi:hypothetical protein
VNTQRIVGLLVVGFAILALWYFLTKKSTATQAAGAPAGIGGTLASILSPGQGGPATVNAGGNIIAAAPRPGSTIQYTAPSGGSSGSWPNIVGNAAALVSALGRAITPGPGQAPAPAVDTSSQPTFTIGQTQGLADLSALTAKTQDQTAQISTYDALPSQLVDPGYGSASPDLAANVTGIDTSAIPTLDFATAYDG